MATVVVSSDAREALRALRPVARVVLEDAVLDAVWQDGHLVAATSARRIAEHVGIDAGTAAAALRLLRDRSMVTLDQPTGRDGRFALAVYTVHLPVGVTVTLAPCTDHPHTVRPCTVTPDAESPASTAPPRRARPSSKRAVQATLDLGLGNP